MIWCAAIRAGRASDLSAQMPSSGRWSHRASKEVYEYTEEGCEAQGRAAESLQFASGVLLQRTRIGSRVGRGRSVDTLYEQTCRVGIYSWDGFLKRAAEGTK
jgi:hypothetical protein